MTINIDEEIEKFECAHIKVVVVGNSNTYRTNHELNYVVKVNDIEPATNFIKKILKLFDIECLTSMAALDVPTPCSLAYITGFENVTKNSISTKTRILESTVGFAKALTTIDDMKNVDMNQIIKLLSSEEVANKKK